MKVLVTAASKYDSTGEIARAIGAALRSRGLAATVARPKDVRSLDSYDAVVVGSAVHAGHWLKPARKLVARQAKALASRPVWLFSSDPGTADGDPIDVGEMTEALRARGHRVFAGQLERRRLNLVERTTVSAFKAPEGNFRDWPAIAAWADDIAGALNAGAAA